MSACPRCVERGQTWSGGAPRCAFTDDGRFGADNWNCATMNELRDHAENDAVWSEDQHAALLAYDGCFIVLGWYKSRGTTEYAAWLEEATARPLMLEQADAYLAVSSRETGHE